MELRHDQKVDANDLAYILKNFGLVSKSTHNYAIRFAPALVIKEDEILKASRIIKKGVRALEKLNRERKKESKK